MSLLASKPVPFPQNAAAERWRCAVSCYSSLNHRPYLSLGRRPRYEEYRYLLGAHARCHYPSRRCVRYQVGGCEGLQGRTVDRQASEGKLDVAHGLVVCHQG